MVYDLGSGDGRIVIMAAQKFGARAVGVEIQPDLCRKAVEKIKSLGGIAAIRPLLLTTPFESWHGLLAQHPFYAPLIWGLIASAGWCVVCLTTAFISLRRRDIAGG